MGEAFRPLTSILRGRERGGGDYDTPEDMDSLMVTLKSSEKFIAGLYLEQAWKGQRLPELDLDNFYEQVTGSKAQIRRGQRLFSLQRTLEHVAKQSVTLLLLLSFFERPSWCVGNHAYRCAAPYARLYPRARLPLATPETSFLLGLAPLAPLLALSYVDIQVKLALPMKVTWRDMIADASRYRIVVTVLLGAACLFRHSGGDETAGLLVATPLLRAAVALTNFPAVRQQIKLIFWTAPAMAAVLFLICVVIGFYAWIGIVLFPRGTAQGDEVFPDFYEAYWQLLVLATTANYPDVMQRAYGDRKS